MNKNRDFFSAGKITAFLVLIAIFFTPFAIVDAGQRGVLLKFGEVQDQVLGEGIHLIIPIVNTVKKLSVRVQEQEISAEASSKDLQKVFTEVVLNWHIIPEEANTIFQQLGDEKQVVERIISPAVEEVLKAILAEYSADDVVTSRGKIKDRIDDAVSTRLARYHIGIDDLSLVDVNFSKEFEESVEAKQIAKQEAKRAEFLALRAAKEAEAKVNLAKGDAEAQMLLRDTLTPELLHRQAIEKWDGKLPLFLGKDGVNLVDLSDFAKPNQSSSDQ